MSGYDLTPAARLIVERMLKQRIRISVYALCEGGGGPKPLHHSVDRDAILEAMARADNATIRFWREGQAGSLGGVTFDWRENAVGGASCITDWSKDDLTNRLVQAAITDTANGRIER